MYPVPLGHIHGAWEYHPWQRPQAKVTLLVTMSPSGVIFPPTANNLPAENLRTQYMGYTNNFNMFPIQYYHPANIFVARIVSQRLDLSAQSVYLPNGTLFA